MLNTDLKSDSNFAITFEYKVFETTTRKKNILGLENTLIIQPLFIKMWRQNEFELIYIWIQLSSYLFPLHPLRTHK